MSTGQQIVESVIVPFQFLGLRFNKDVFGLALVG